jgi:hypothetical protein
MAVKTSGEGRVRAWVLVQAGDPGEVAQRLYEMLGHQGGDEYVVVRADVVDYSHNIVIPVDAESDDALTSVLDMIGGLRGVETTAVVPVIMSVPYPPHIAHGYITHEELDTQLERGIDIDAEGLKAGRQGASPGHNAWG